MLCWPQEFVQTSMLMSSNPLLQFEACEEYCYKSEPQELQITLHHPGSPRKVTLKFSKLAKLSVFLNEGLKKTSCLGSSYFSTVLYTVTLLKERGANDPPLRSPAGMEKLRRIE
jgi:hypothetical protein